MNNLTVLDQREVLGKDFKIYGDNENPLFLAKDVAEWIEHSDRTKMLKGIDEEEKVKNIIPTLGGNQEMWFLTEDGLYEVLIQSRKPIAKEFKKEVKRILKQLRTTGASFIQGREAEAVEHYFSNFSDDVKKVMAIDLAKRNDEIQRELLQAKEQIKVDAPKVEAYEEFIDRDKTYSLNEASKIVRIKQQIMVKYLQDVKLITKFMKPSSIAVGKDLVVIKISEWGEQTRITPKGIDYINKNYKSYKHRKVKKK